MAVAITPADEKLGGLMRRDLRHYASQTTFRLVAGSLLLLFTIGLGAIWWIYGPYAALMGFLCLLGALIPIGLIALSIYGMDWVVRRGNRD
jgi:predicted PurR-regulated permease PerM